MQDAFATDDGRRELLLIDNVLTLMSSINYNLPLPEGKLGCSTDSMPKAATTAGDTKQLRRHHPLSEEYAPTQALKQKARKKRKLQQDEDEETYVDTKASRKILRIGQDLVEEDLQAQRVPTTSTAFALDSRIGDDHADSDRDSETYEDGEEWGDDEGNDVQDKAVILWKRRTRHMTDM